MNPRVHCTVVKNTILAQRPESTVTPRQNRSIQRSQTIDVLNVFLYLFLYLVYKRTLRTMIVPYSVRIDNDYFRSKNDRGEMPHVVPQLKATCSFTNIA